VQDFAQLVMCHY